MIALLAEASLSFDLRSLAALAAVAAVSRYGPELLHRIEARLRRSGHEVFAESLELLEAAWNGVHDAHGAQGLEKALDAAKAAAPERADDLEGVAARVLLSKKES